MEKERKIAKELELTKAPEVWDFNEDGDLADLHVSNDHHYDYMRKSAPPAPASFDPNAPPPGVFKTRNTTVNPYVNRQLVVKSEAPPHFRDRSTPRMVKGSHGSTFVKEDQLSLRFGNKTVEDSAVKETPVNRMGAAFRTPNVDGGDKPVEYYDDTQSQSNSVGPAH